jgi:hypothetical protein
LYCSPPPHASHAPHMLTCEVTPSVPCIDEAEGPGRAQEPARRAQLPVRQRRRRGAGRGRVRVGGEGRAALEPLAFARPPRAGHQPHPRTALAPASQARPRGTPHHFYLHPAITCHHCTHITRVVSCAARVVCVCVVLCVARDRSGRGRAWCSTFCCRTVTALCMRMVRTMGLNALLVTGLVRWG